MGVGRPPRARGGAQRGRSGRGEAKIKREETQLGEKGTCPRGGGVAQKGWRRKAGPAGPKNGEGEERNPGANWRRWQPSEDGLGEIGRERGRGEKDKVRGPPSHPGRGFPTHPFHQ